jgi:hypothetical protein
MSDSFEPTDLPKSFYNYEIESNMCECAAGLHERITLMEWVNSEWVRYVDIDCFDKDKFDVSLLLPEGYIEERGDVILKEITNGGWEVRDCCENKDCKSLMATATVETLKQVEKEVELMFNYQRAVGLSYWEMSKR